MQFKKKMHKNSSVGHLSLFSKTHFPKTSSHTTNVPNFSKKSSVQNFPHFPNMSQYVNTGLNYHLPKNVPVEKDSTSTTW